MSRSRLFPGKETHAQRVRQIKSEEKSSVLLSPTKIIIIYKKEPASLRAEFSKLNLSEGLKHKIYGISIHSTSL